MVYFKIGEIVKKGVTMNNEVIITCNGTSKSYKKNTTYYDISKDFCKDNSIVAVMANNDVKELSDKVLTNQNITFLDCMSSTGNKIYENGLNYLLEYSFKRICGNEASIKCEHSADKGLYFTVHGIKLDREILSNVKSDIPFLKCNVLRKEAINYFKKHNRSDLVSVLNYISNSYINLYKLDNMYNYFYGKMPYSTGVLRNFDLTYIEPNGVVLQYPNQFVGLEIKPYKHHTTVFNTFAAYTSWLESIGVSKSYELNKLVSDSKINDIIAISEMFQNNNLLNIAREIAGRKEIKIVLIAGPSSSGKTTTSKKLSLYLKGLGLKPHPIALDDYFLDRDECKRDEHGNLDFESVNALDLNLFNDHLTRLLNKERVQIPTYDFIEGKKIYGSRYLELGKDDILVIEGLHGLNEILTSSIPRNSKYKIYISPLTSLNIDNYNRLRSTDVRLIRRMVRDNRTRGYTSAMTLKSWKTVREGEEKYVFPFQDEADVVFNTSLVYEIGLLKTYVEPLLFAVDNNDPNYSEALRLLNILRIFLTIPGDNVPKDSILREFIGGSTFE